MYAIPPERTTWKGKLPNGLPEGVTWFDVDANDRADYYAGEAAKATQLPRGVTYQLIKQMYLITKIQKRLAAILLNLPQRKIEKIAKPDPIPRIGLQEILQNTSHSIVHSQSRLSCTECMNSFLSSDASCKRWLSSPCSRIAFAPHITHVKINYQDSIHLGNRVIHGSHNLFKYRWLIYCLKCGAIGTNQVRILADQLKNLFLLVRVHLDTYWMANCHLAYTVGQKISKDIGKNFSLFYCLFICPGCNPVLLF